MKTATPTSQRHFVRVFTAYLESVVLEAANRNEDTILGIDEYINTRRDNVGTRPSCFPLEAGLDIPDDVFYHPTIVELSDCVADLVMIDNDLCSYNREQATGNDGNNLLTVVMHQLNCDLDGAVQWAARYHSEVEARFMDGINRIPSWGIEIDKRINKYVQGLANFPRGHICWSFESNRYFGDKGLEVQKTRFVPLIPKFTRDDNLREHNVVVPMVEIMS